MEWRNSTNYNGIEISLLRDSNSVLGRDGWKVIINQATHPMGRLQLPFSVEDAKSAFKGKISSEGWMIFLVDHTEHGIAFCSGYRAWNRNEAEGVAILIKNWIDTLSGEDATRKLRRRIEDALRKTASYSDLQVIAGLLGIEKV